MSWMAITEGARGVFYWSYGLRGLDWGKRDPVLRQQRYDELVNVTKGISALEPVLLAPDSPVLSANSAAGTVITKEKDLRDGSRYLISYNHSGSSVDGELHAAAARSRGIGVTARIVQSRRIKAAPDSKILTLHFRLTFTR